MLTALLPPPFLADGDEGVLARLASAEQRRRLAMMMESGLPGWDSHLHGAGWDGILVSTTASHRYEGQTVAELARASGELPLDTFIRILREEELHVTMVLFSMDEQDVRTAFADEDTMVGSDGLPPATAASPTPAVRHLPRVLAEYVRRHHILPLGEAVRRMTSLPAKVFRIPERGRVAKGLIADLVAFDPQTIDHECDYRDPVRPPSGIAWVMQEGAMVVDGRTYTGPRRGRAHTRGLILPRSAIPRLEHRTSGRYVMSEQTPRPGSGTSRPGAVTSTGSALPLAEPEHMAGRRPGGRGAVLRLRPRDHSAA